MTQISHNIFGNINYDVYWCRDYVVPFLGELVPVRLVVDGDEDAEFEQSQIQAFIEFEKNISILMKEAENSLLTFYQENLQENRKRYPDNFEEVLPVITNKEELSSVLSFIKIVVAETFDENEREIGLMFDATWEPDLGIGVKLVNEKIAEVGTQDILL
jgi:hypothetical protein